MKDFRYSWILVVAVIGVVGCDDGRSSAVASAKVPSEATTPQESPPAEGLYETWSRVRMAPAGRLGGRPEESELPRWLEVRHEGGEVVVTFQPDGRVVWRVEWGEHGVHRKRVEVDGQRVTVTEFSYDDRGHLEEKRVHGPGIAGRRVWGYRTDGRGRVVERTRRVPDAEEEPADRWKVRWRPDGARAERYIDGRRVRVDVYDEHGLPIRTEFLGHPPRRAELHYQRDGAGRLVEVRRRLGDREEEAIPHRPDPAIGEKDLWTVDGEVPVQRHETLLLLGAPVTHTDDHRGLAREQNDKYLENCWQYDVSGLKFDGTGLRKEGTVSCVCGFCVDADLAVEADEVRGVDLHWTTGPWVRLDGRVNVTADHEVVTPQGLRAAGRLEAGDRVLRSGGEVHRLESVEYLAARRLREGRNVRTDSGWFAAGGFLFASEQPEACRRGRSDAAGIREGARGSVGERADPPERAADDGRSGKVGADGS